MYIIQFTSQCTEHTDCVYTCIYMYSQPYLEDTSGLEGPVLISRETGDIDSSGYVDALCQV